MIKPTIEVTKFTFGIRKNRISVLLNVLCTMISGRTSEMTAKNEMKINGRNIKLLFSENFRCFTERFKRTVGRKRWKWSKERGKCDIVRLKRNECELWVFQIYVNISFLLLYVNIFISVLLRTRNTSRPFFMIIIERIYQMSCQW